MTTAPRALLAEVARAHGTPAYVYLWDAIAERIAYIRRLFGDRVQLSYAVKANPNRALLRRMSEVVDLLDLSSGGELELALGAGYAPGRLSFSGPGKSRSELERAVSVGCEKIIIESLGELEELEEVAQARQRPAGVLLRINPQRLPRAGKGFGIGMSGQPSQFGIDEEEVDGALERLSSSARVRLAGLHVYAATQSLTADAIVQNVENCAAIFAGAAERHRLRPAWLIFGSGFGIPYHEGDSPLDLPAVAARLVPIFDELRARPGLQDAAFVLELGRYLVGEAGYFLTRVLRVKPSRGKRFCICDGGMNHQLAASGHFGSVIFRNYPLYSVTADGPSEAQDLVGPLCTNIDQLGRGASLPRLAPGDVVAVGCSGAYGLTASPRYFISHRAPREILVSSGRMEDITAESVPALYGGGLGLGTP